MPHIFKYYDLIVCCSQDHRRDYIPNPFNSRNAEAEKESIINSFQSSVQQIVSAISTTAANIKCIAISNVDQAVATLGFLPSISAQIASEIYSTLNRIASKAQMSASPQLPHPTDGRQVYSCFAVDISDLLRKLGPAHRYNFFAHIGHYLGA